MNQIIRQRPGPKPSRKNDPIKEPEMPEKQKPMEQSNYEPMAQKTEKFPEEEAPKM